jgi:selenocysteine lyase/cysteine desulfurase
MTVLPDRRAFLKSLTVSAAAPVVAQLTALEAGLAAEIGSLPRLEAPLPPPQEMRDRYFLDPSVSYLNHASIGTVPRVVHSAGMRYRQICEENPWLYIWGGAWEDAREEVREAAARLLGCDPEDVAITHNTTEGFNLFAQGLPLGPGDEVLFSSLNHAGASICWDHFGRALGYAVRRFEFPLEDAPGLSPEDVVRIHEEQIRDETRVLVFPHMDNIVGLRHPMAALASTAKARGVEFVLVDGAQTAGMIPLEVADSGVDGFSTSPHKWVQSPKGLGLLFLTREIQERLRPMWVTWGQARWSGTARKYEDYGTRDLPEVLSLGDALTFQQALDPGRKERRYQEMFRRFLEATDASSAVEWRSPRRWEMGGVLTSVRLLHADATETSDALFQDFGVVVRAFPQEGLNALRVSPNLLNSLEEMQRLISILERTSR